MNEKGPSVLSWSKDEGVVENSGPGRMLVVQPNKFEVPAMSERRLSRGSSTVGALVPFALLVSALAAIPALGPRSAEAQSPGAESPEALPRQGIPMTQQGILAENGGAPLPGPDDRTLYVRREAAEENRRLRIGGETRAPDPRWVTGAQWPIPNVAVQTNETDTTEGAQPEAPRSP